MTPETASGIKNKEVVAAKREKPYFIAQTAAKVALILSGGVGFFAMISDGKEIVAKNNLEDPAISIGEKLSVDLSAKYGAKLTAKPVKAIPIQI